MSSTTRCLRRYSRVRPCVCSAGKVPVLLLDLLPNVLSKASSIYAVFVLLDLGLKPGKMRLNKGLELHSLYSF